MIEIEMKLFGAFRKYHQGQSPVMLIVKTPVTIVEIKSELTKMLSELSREFDKNGEQLVIDSAIANDQEVLVPGAMIIQSCKLSILPPVCGG